MSKLNLENPFPLTLRQLQKEQAEWRKYNFPNNQSYHPVLGVMEEWGEFCHALLRLENGIKYSPDVCRDKMEDAVGDMVIFLASVCEFYGFDLQTAVEKAWTIVKNRDWVKYPKNGMTE